MKKAQKSIKGMIDFLSFLQSIGVNSSNYERNYKQNSRVGPERYGFRL